MGRWRDRGWSPDEIALLEAKAADSGSFPELAAHFPHRSLDAVRGKCRMIGISMGRRKPLKEGFKPWRYWTESETALLKKMYPKCSSREQIMPFLPKRTPAAVTSQALFLGLRMNSEVGHIRDFREVSEADLAWVAGFLDGEGTIGLCFYSSGRVFVNVRASNTHRPSVDRLEALTGVGAVYATRTAKGHRPCFAWQVNRRNDALCILRSIQPYLFTKAEQAAIVLAFGTGTVSGQEARRRLLPLNSRGTTRHPEPTTKVHI